MARSGFQWGWSVVVQNNGRWGESEVVMRVGMANIGISCETKILGRGGVASWNRRLVERIMAGEVRVK